MPVQTPPSNTPTVLTRSPFTLTPTLPTAPPSTPLPPYHATTCHHPVPRPSFSVPVNGGGTSVLPPRCVYCALNAAAHELRVRSSMYERRDGRVRRARRRWVAAKVAYHNLLDEQAAQEVQERVSRVRWAEGTEEGHGMCRRKRADRGRWLDTSGLTVSYEEFYDGEGEEEEVVEEEQEVYEDAVEVQPENTSMYGRLTGRVRGWKSDLKDKVRRRSV